MNNIIPKYLSAECRFYKSEAEWQTRLTVYRKKDMVEMAFKMLKSDVRMAP